MNFNKHSNLAGLHAFLSPSSYHWVNYDEDKLDRVFFTNEAARRGTEIHAFAHEAIRLGIKLPVSRKTLNLYVNDAIGYRMTPEQTLFYSPNCFGCADALGFRRDTLRIHDLKTGVTPAGMTQLKIYAALFCLEYRFKPSEIKMELRMYQNDDIEVLVPDPMDIVLIMDKIVTFDKRIAELRLEGPL
jgi:hypothetical protein